MSRCSCAARTQVDLVLRDEIADEVDRRGGRFWEAVGPREKVRITASTLRRALPDIHRRDVYICGPEAFTASVAEECARAGIPADRVHFESFVF